MAYVEQTQQMIPFVTCEISLGYHVGKLVFCVDVFDLDFGGPNQFDRATSQAQLCGFWPRVSLLDSFL